MPLFQNRSPQPSNGQLFAKRQRRAFQEGSGWLSSIGSVFSRVLPKVANFAAKSVSKAGDVIKKAASSELGQSIKKSVGDTAKETIAGLAGDIIGGTDLKQASENAQTRLQSSRKQIADLIQNAGKTKSKSKRKKEKQEDKVDDLDEDDIDDESDESGDDFEAPPPPKKRKKQKKNVTSTKGKSKKKKSRKYSVFDD